MLDQTHVDENISRSGSNSYVIDILQFKNMLYFTSLNLCGCSGTNNRANDKKLGDERR